MYNTSIVLNHLNKKWDDIAIGNSTTKLSYGNLIHSILKNRSISKVAKDLMISTRVFDRHLAAAFPLRDKHTRYYDYLSSIIGIKECSICRIQKPSNDFVVSQDLKFGIGGHCKVCDVARKRVYSLNNKDKMIEYRKFHYSINHAKYKYKSASRRIGIREHTPKWADLEAIKSFYLNKPLGCHVDHIIPLHGKLVSGLHVIENLQYLTKKQNLQKYNKYAVV